jgi:hypothetical protein
MALQFGRYTTQEMVLTMDSTMCNGAGMGRLKVKRLHYSEYYLQVYSGNVNAGSSP